MGKRPLVITTGQPEQLQASEDLDTYNVSIFAGADRLIQVAEESDTGIAGRNLTVRAGAANAGSTNKAGGTLNLSGGFATGSGISGVVIGTAIGAAIVSTISATSAEVSINTAGVATDFRVKADGGSTVLYVDADNARLGVQIDAPLHPVHVEKSIASGRLVFVKHTLTTRSTADQNDVGIDLAQSITVSSASNHLVLRGMRVASTNSLTGGGTLTNLRAIEFGVSVAASATATEAVPLYIFAANNGTITNFRAIHISNGVGTNKWGIYDQSGGRWENTAGSVVIGSPTGGDKGAGSINAQAVYDDNVLLTDHLFDRYYDGESKQSLDTEVRDVDVIDFVQDGQTTRAVTKNVSKRFWRGSSVEVTDQEFEKYQAAEVAPVIGLEAMGDFVRINRHLPTIQGREEWKQVGRPGVGKIISQLYETVEYQALYILELHERVKALEARG